MRKSMAGAKSLLTADTYTHLLSDGRELDLDTLLAKGMAEPSASRFRRARAVRS
jgi:hypothetical protein